MGRRRQIQDFFKHEIKKLTSCWATVVENKGDYIFYDNI